MKRGMTIEYLKCRADLNFEVDIGVNGAFGTSVTKWDLILFGYFICFHPYFLNTHHMLLTKGLRLTVNKYMHNHVTD